MYGDEQTIASYDRLGKEFAQDYRSIDRLSRERLADIFAKCTSVLEIGVGSGIDMAALLELGYDVVGVEPSASLIEQAYKYFPSLRGRIQQLAFPLEKGHLDAWRQRFDGINCSAVLMHISGEVRSNVLLQLSQILKDQGVLHLLISEHRDGLNNEGRDQHGRLYVPTPSSEIIPESVKAGFELVAEEALRGTKLSRGNDWKRLIFKKKLETPSSF